VKAIRIDRTGGPEVLTLVDVPRPEPRPGTVLVRQSVAGINFIDCYIRSGLYQRELPLILGFEGAGVVEAVGADVTALAAGDRIGYAQAGATYAEYAVVPESEAVPIPAGVTDDVACALMLQGMTAHYLAHSTYPIAAGDTVVVHAAAGGVGLLLVQIAKLQGATVIATAGGAEKVELARGAGADHVIDYRDVDFAPEVMRLTNGAGVAAVYDSVGRDTFDRSLSVLAKRGYLVLYGASSGPVPPFDAQRLSAGGSLFLTRPTLGDYKRTRAETLARADDLFALVAAHKLDVRIGHEYPLADTAAAHRDLEARKTTGKILLTME
jgi:NADPH2:quinone reductase